jgi:hypothetical protein
VIASVGQTLLHTTQPLHASWSTRGFKEINFIFVHLSYSTAEKQISYATSPRGSASLVALARLSAAC